MNTAALGAMSALGLLVRIGFEIALIVVAMTTVRTTRADAAPLLAGAGGVQLFGSIAGYALSMAMPLVGGGSDGFMLGFAAEQGFSVLTSSVAYVLLILAIVRLARPAQSGAVDPGRYT